MQIERISQATEFEALGPAWNELLEDSPANSLFLTWEWLFTWWKHLAHGARLEILAVREGEELVGLAPLVRRKAWVGPLISAPTLEFLGTGSVGSDYLDLIIRRGWRREVVNALSGHWAEGDALLRLAQLRPGSAAADLGDRLHRRGWFVAESQTDVCPFIPLAGHTWNSYLAGLGPEHRYNIRRKLEKLTRQFDVFFEEVSWEKNRREALETLTALHQARWRARGGSQAFHTPGLLSFHEEFSRLALARGWLRLFVLRLDGEPVAALYGFRHGPTFYFYQSGFDPTRSKDSPGLVCMGRAIKKAIEEGAEEYDLLHGDESYKSLWAQETRPLTRIELFPPRARGLLWQEALTLTRAAKRVARRVLPPALATWIAARRDRTGTTDAQPA